MPWVLFFDGDCTLCQQSVCRLCRWDKRGRIHYAPLQGELAASHGLASFLYGEDASMVLLNEESGEILTQSESLLSIFRILGFPWRLLMIFGCLPRRVRNGLYRWVAGRRRALSAPGQPACLMPDQDLIARFRK